MPKFYNRSEAEISSSAYKKNPDRLLEPPHLLESHDNFTDEDDSLLKTLLSWRAPDRPYRKKDRSYLTTVATILILLSLISILLGERLLIMALLAFGFVVYVLNNVPPTDVDYKITSQGITIGDHFYHWQELDSFWISEKEGHKILNVLTNLRFPAMLIILLDGVEEEKVKRACASFLPFHEIPPKTIMDKWSESLQKHFPLENPRH